MGEEVAQKSFFARWRLPGRSWSQDHWFRDGRTACGRVAPGAAQVEIPPRPILTCFSCIAAIERRDAAVAEADHG